MGVGFIGGACALEVEGGVGVGLGGRLSCVDGLMLKCEEQG